MDNFDGGISTVSFGIDKVLKTLQYNIVRFSHSQIDIMTFRTPSCNNNASDNFYREKFIYIRLSRNNVAI